MDPVPLFAGFGGFMIGLLVWSRIIRWLHSLWLVHKERRRDPARRSRWRLFMTVFLHSGPWMLAILFTMMLAILPSPHLPGWNDFFWGMLASLILQALLVLWVIRLWRLRQRNAAKAAATTNEV